MQEKPTSQKEPKSKKGLLILLLIIIALLLCSIGTLIYWLLTRKEGEEPQSQKQSCLYNDQTYNDGDSFDAADGCNTCSCNNGEVACTLMACDDSGNGAGPEVGPYEGWKIYTHEEYGFSFKYPSDWEIESEDGKPWDKPWDMNSNETGYGFNVIVANTDWKFSVRYMPYLDDITIGELDHESNLEIQDATSVRAAQMDFDSLNMVANEEIKYFTVMSPESYESTKNAETPRGFTINNTLFSVTYHSTSDNFLTYEDWEDILITFDKMSESLEVETKQVRGKK